jgi:predicted secreted protein
MLKTKCISILIIPLFVILVLPACSIAKSKNLSVNEAYSGKQIVLPVNGFLTVILESGVMEGYSWNELTTIDNSQVIKQTSYEYKPVSPALPEMGTQIWTFKAVGLGTATLSNEYSEIVGSKRSKNFTLFIVVK